MGRRAGMRAVRRLLAVALVATALSVGPTLIVRAVYTATFTVNTIADGSDAALNDGLCQTASEGQCTLRAAIEEANAETPAGPHSINFSIGSGAQTIIPTF